MNSYQLISKLRKVRADTYLTAIDQALYYELVSICNEKGWKDVFEVRSNVLCGALNIWDKTLRKSRDALVQAGLISYETSKDKRVGCLYSFSNKVGNDATSSVISSVRSTEETSDENTEETSDDNLNEKESSVNDTVISSVLRTDENTEESTDDKKTSSVISSVRSTEDGQITPYKGIKTTNKESHAYTREAPPPKKGGSSRKKEGDEKPLEFPFSSVRFMSTWESLCQTPKWRKKLNYALQLSLNKLGKFEEDFAIEQMERAIESNWTGVVFSGTEEKYQEWLSLKYGKTESQRQNNRNADKAAKARMLRDEYAAIDQGSDVVGNQTEVPDL